MRIAKSEVGSMGLISNDVIHIFRNKNLSKKNWKLSRRFPKLFLDLRSGSETTAPADRTSSRDLRLRPACSSLLKSRFKRQVSSSALSVASMVGVGTTEDLNQLLLSLGPGAGKTGGGAGRGRARERPKKKAGGVASKGVKKKTLRKGSRTAAAKAAGNGDEKEREKGKTKPTTTLRKKGAGRGERRSAEKTAPKAACKAKAKTTAKPKAAAKPKAKPKTKASPKKTRKPPKRTTRRQAGDDDEGSDSDGHEETTTDEGSGGAGEFIKSMQKMALEHKRKREASEKKADEQCVQHLRRAAVKAEREIVAAATESSKASIAFGKESTDAAAEARKMGESVTRGARRKTRAATKASIGEAAKELRAFQEPLAELQEAAKKEKEKRHAELKADVGRIKKTAAARGRKRAATDRKLEAIVKALEGI